MCTSFVVSLKAKKKKNGAKKKEIFSKVPLVCVPQQNKCLGAINIFFEVIYSKSCYSLRPHCLQMISNAFCFVTKQINEAEILQHTNIHKQKFCIEQNCLEYA